MEVFAWTLAGLLAAALAFVWRRMLQLQSSAIPQFLRPNEADSINRKADGTEPATPELLAEALTLPIFACDLQGKMVWANSAANRFFNLNGKHRSLLESTLSLELHQLFEKSKQSGPPKTSQITLSYPVPREVLCSCFQLPNEPGFFWFALEDISELTHTRRLRTDFVANASHELRTPMASIRAMTETILEDESLTKQARNRYLNKIISEIDRLAMISEDLLTLSEAESHSPNLVECDFSMLCNYAAAQQEMAAKQKGLDFDLQIEPNLVVMGDEAELVVAVINLISNAIRYTEVGRVRVELQTVGEEAVFKVADTGIGIAEAHLSKLFERFYRVDRARSRSSGGTGLGLSIVKHVVESHGGKVGVSSELNVGSEFTITLPLASRQSIDDETSPQPTEEPSR